MKKTLIVGSFLAFSGIANAQWLTSGSDIYSDPAYPGNVGIGISSPANKLDIDIGPNANLDDGIQVKNTTSTGAPCIFLNNLAYENWKIQSGTSGLFAISNTSSGYLPLFGINSAGQIYGGAGISPFGQFFIGTSTQNWGIRANCNVLNPIATSGFATGTGGAGSLARGILGNATGADDNQGGNFTGLGGTTAKGVYGTANNASTNYGGYFETRGSGCTGTPPQNYGIYARVITPCTNDLAGLFDGNVTINGTAAPSGNPGGIPPPGPYALRVNGNAYSTAGGWYFASDRRFKDNIKPLSNALEKMKKITGYNYTFKTEEFKEMNFNTDNQIGFIAQELKEVFPELVREGTDGYLAVNYQGMIPVLLEATKEQQNLIETLQQQVNDQKQMINDLQNKSNTATGINQIQNIETGFSLSQNEPNPFTHETVIKYTLTEQTKTATLNVYDLSGKQITSFPLNDKGASSITITSEKLAAGIYIYSIVADGKIMDSKRMVVADK